MITQHQAEQEALAKELEEWAAKLPCPVSGNWKWTFLTGEFDLLFDDRITFLVNRPGDAMTRQRLDKQYQRTKQAINQMDDLCTDPRCWSEKRAQSEDAWMAAHDGIRETRKEVRQLANLIRDGFPAQRNTNGSTKLPEPGPAQRNASGSEGRAKASRKEPASGGEAQDAGRPGKVCWIALYNDMEATCFPQHWKQDQDGVPGWYQLTPDGEIHGRLFKRMQRKSLDSKDLLGAIRFWEAYPHFFRCCRQNGCDAGVGVLGSCHERVETLLCAAAEQRGLDSSAIYRSGRACRAMFEGHPELADHIRSTRWPVCLDDIDVEPPESPEAISAAADLLRRLEAKLTGERELSAGAADAQQTAAPGAGAGVVAQADAKEQPWADDAPKHLPLKEALKLIEGRFSLSTLSKLCKPDGEMRYMRKPGSGCKVHVGDFRRYMQGRQSDPKWAKTYIDFREALGKGDRRWFWQCQNKDCGHEYAENATAPERCPKCKGEVELKSKTAPKPRR